MPPGPCRPQTTARIYQLRFTRVLWVTFRGVRGRCVRPKTTVEVGAVGGTLLVEWVDQWRMPPTDTVLGWAPLFLVLLPSALEKLGDPK